MSCGDTLQITGLSVIVSADVPFLEFEVACQGRTYRTTILEAGECFGMAMRRDDGQVMPGAGDSVPDQYTAIVAALTYALTYTAMTPDEEARMLAGWNRNGTRREDAPPS